MYTSFLSHYTGLYLTCWEIPTTSFVRRGSFHDQLMYNTGQTIHVEFQSNNCNFNISFADFMIAGHTSDFVNKVVRAVEAGDTTGGIEIRASRSYPEELHN